VRVPDGARSQIRVMIVDDDAMVCATLASYVSRAPGLDLVGSCRNGSQAVDLLMRSRVDVVLMDIRMDVMDGITATRTLRQLGIPVKIIALTTFDDDRNMLAALNAGANGFMLKDSKPESIIEAINLAHSGGSVISAQPAARLVERYLPRHTPSSVPLENAHGLSARELAVLQELCRAASNAEIADRLSIAENTVKTYVSSIIGKLGCTSRLKAVIKAFELGLVEPPPRSTAAADEMDT
jgi:DNA-binding NarL/FixJ family response regulator